jgi:hypothetical protein
MGGNGGSFGVDLHRDGDLAVPQDAHGDSRMDVERGQQRGTGLAGAVDGNPGTRAAMMQRPKLRPKVRGSIGVPCRVVKIRPVSIKAARRTARAAASARSPPLPLRR